MSSSSTSSVKDVIVDARISKLLAMRSDSAAMLDALDTISEFYTSNTMDARRILRQDLEFQNITLAKKFLTEFDAIRDKIEGVETLAVNLEGACDKLAEKVHEADENMKLFMEKASLLENNRNFYMTQSKEIGFFLSRFQISTEEIDILYTSDIERSDSANAFFEGLGRLQVAYKDCQILVEKHSYDVGFELLEVLGNHQDVAYQHLFEWVKNKCDYLANTGSVEDIETSTKLQVAIRYLKKLPVYFDQCQDLLVNSRRAQLVQKFVVALTQGDSSHGGKSSSNRSSLRAIDLLAHDPVRYVGGMLAWMHQAFASELEFLEAIFSSEADLSRRGGRGAPTPQAPEDPSSDPSTSTDNSINNNNNSSSSSSSSSSSGSGSSGGGSSSSSNNSKPGPKGLSILEMLTRCVQGLGRPLRVRITQTLENSHKLEVLYSLSDLLTFYEGTFHRIVPAENAVHSAVKGCLMECRRMFQSSLTKQSQTLISSPVSYPLDLKASHTTRECASQIEQILIVYGSALSNMPFDTNDDFHIDAILGNIIQPVLQSCRLGCQSLQQAEMAIFLLNNISLFQHEISEASKRSQKSFGETSWLQLIDGETQTWVDILIREEVGRMLKRSDLDKLLELIEVLPEGLKAAGQAGLGQDRVGTVLRSFYASLFSTLAPQFERLQDPSVRESIRNGTAMIISESHSKVYEFVTKPVNGYDTTILSHSQEEVKVLLGCE